LLRKDEWPLVLRPNEVAQVLRIDEEIVLQLAKEKTIPAIKLGQEYLIPKAWLIDTLEHKSKLLETVQTEEITKILANKCVFGADHDTSVSLRYCGRVICSSCAAELVAALLPIGQATLRKPVNQGIKSWAAQIKNCGYCGKRLRSKNRVIDHIVPVSQGGQTKKDNLVVVCNTCNQEKGARTLQEWKVKLEDELNWLESLAKPTKTSLQRKQWIMSVLSNIDKM